MISVWPRLLSIPGLPPGLARGLFVILILAPSMTKLDYFLSAN